MLRTADKKLLPVVGRVSAAMLEAGIWPRCVGGSATTQITSSTATPTVNLPTTKAGDILFVFLRAPASTSTVNPSATGWSLIASVGSPDASDDTVGLFCRLCDGTEGASVTFNSWGTARTWAAVAFAVRGGAWETIESSGNVAQGGAGTAADPPALSPGLGKLRYLWLAFASYESAITVTAAPDSYSGLATITNGSSGAAGCTVAGAWRQREAASEDPGTFTGSGSNAKTNATVCIGPKQPRLAITA